MPVVVQRQFERIQTSPLASRLTHGIFWSFLGTAMSRVLSLGATILVARFLGVQGVGEIGVVQSTVGIFSSLAGMGMGLTATKFVAEYRTSYPKRAGAMLGASASITWISGTIMAVVMALLAPWFATHTLAAPHLAPLIQTGSLLLLFGSVAGAQMGALAGFEAFRTIARVNLVAGVTAFPILVGGAWFGGVNGLVWGLIINQVFICLYTHLAIRREAKLAGVPLLAKLDTDQWSDVWRFSLPSILCTMLFGPANWACSALLVNQAGGYSEMGIFNVASNWFNAVSFLPAVIASVILPLISHQVGEKEISGQRKIISMSMWVTGIALVPLVLVIALASPFIMAAYGNEFRHGWPTLIVTVVTAMVLGVQAPAVQSITAHGKMWIIFGTYVFYSLLYVILTYTLLSYGSLGMACARLITYSLNGLLIWWIAYKTIWSQPKQL